MLETIATIGILVCQNNANCGAWVLGGGAQVVVNVATSQLLYDERPLAIPRAPTGVPLEWEWSLSPNGKVLAVRRMRRGEITGESTGAMSPNADWSGVINLDTFAVSPRPLGPLLGWRDTTPLTTALLASPTESALAVAPNGRTAVIHDGRDGNVTDSLRELASGRVRVLYKSEVQKSSSYADMGGVVSAAFSRDGALLATLTLDSRNQSSWHATVKIESIDGTQELSRDEFLLEKTGPVPELSWAPAGPERLLWWSRAERKTSLQVATVDSATRSFKSQRYATSLYSRLLYQFPMLWSPDATQLAWVDPRRRIVTLALQGGRNRLLGKLPADARSWSWASPRVMQVR